MGVENASVCEPAPARHHTDYQYVACFAQLFARVYLDVGLLFLLGRFLLGRGLLHPFRHL